ncbi:cytochrome P450 [Neoconidiobolus thromboides FSU 785]|nr:cytochrome P450 [Neoconidiobolus thromboides FSU 785]
MDNILSFIKGESFAIRHKKFFEPVMKETEYAMMWQQGNWELLVSDTLSVKYILNNTDVFLKKKEEAFTKDQLGYKLFGSSNIVNNDTLEWKRHRRIINPAFKKSWSTELFGDCTNEFINIIEKKGGQPVEIRTLLQHLALDILGKGLFSFDFEAVKNGDKSEMLFTYNEIMKGLFNPIYFLFPKLETIIPSRQYYHLKNEEFRSFLIDIITLRKKEIENGDAKEDLLTLMLKNSLESKEDCLTNEEVVNNLASFFLAGHDTTTNALTSAVYFLAKYPQIQQKVRNEIIHVLGANENTIPSHEKQKQLIYLNCFIKETMRFIPTVSLLKRYCIQDQVLPNNLLVKKDSFVYCYLWGLHHNSKNFPNPDQFDPDRFLDPYGEQSSSWMPFSGGSRLCVGMNFSLIEQRIVLCLLLQKFQIQLGPRSKNWESPLLSDTGFIHIKDLDIQFIDITNCV